MALISLEGMRFRAFHGVYEEESIIGNDFILDVFIDTDVQNATTLTEHNMEKVDNTVNYEIVYDICKVEMRKPQKLLETVMANIFYALKYHFRAMEQLHVRVKKLNPPLGGRVDSAAVFNIKSYVEVCGRCSSKMICYKHKMMKTQVMRDGTCWCEQEGARETIHPRTLEMLDGQYKGCMCQKCLKEFSG